MKNWIILLLLLSYSCKESGTKNNGSLNTILEIKLSDKLPFKSVKLHKYDPVYGSLVPFDYQVSKEKDSFVFKFNMTQPGFIHLADENDIGVIDIFLDPGENFGAEIYWKKQDPIIKMKIKPCKWPGDNLLYQSIHDSISILFKTTKINTTSFTQRKSINDYVEKQFNQIVTPALHHYSNLETSGQFYNQIMQPQLELIKCVCKNQLINKSIHKNEWKKFYADRVFANPNYKFWCERYLEAAYFEDYLFGSINNFKANNLREYIQNIVNFYKNENDSILTKIAVSRGLESFSEKFSFKVDDISLPIILDSICRVYSLDIKKYNFPNFSTDSLSKLDSGLFDKINLGVIKNENIITLHKVINDTSKVYYIDYWASWCRPCVEGLPYTINLYKKDIPALKVLFLVQIKPGLIFYLRQIN